MFRVYRFVESFTKTVPVDEGSPVPSLRIELHRDELTVNTLCQKGGS
jgi:hypothetical protein